MVIRGRVSFCEHKKSTLSLYHLSILHEKSLIMHKSFELDRKGVVEIAVTPIASEQIKGFSFCLHLWRSAGYGLAAIRGLVSISGH